MDLSKSNLLYYCSEIWILLKRLGIILLYFTLLRVLFLLFNLEHFREAGVFHFIVGLRFDISSIAYLFSPFILLYLLPFNTQANKLYRNILKYLFLTLNGICLVANLSDIIYFRFISRRSTAEVIDYFTVSGDGWNMLHRFLYDYWYLVPVFLLLMFVSGLLYEMAGTNRYPKPVTGSRYYLERTVLLVLAIPAIILAGRGGLQGRPLQIIDANLSVQAGMAPLVVNTPFSIMTTIGRTSALPDSPVSVEEARKYFTLRKNIKGLKADAEKKNVVIIILESFAREYIGFYNDGKGYTPFLDSLMERSLVFRKSYGNGKRSIDALPSIIAGLPALMNEPFIYSIYSANKLNTLPGYLKPEGYVSAFFHGGNNGTMGFDAFAQMAGFDQYHGKEEYLESTGLEENFDGYWGIYDEPFLKYTATEIGKLEEPFLSTIFTLSSHHPYTIPEKHRGVFPKGTLNIHESIGYADYSLRKFFEEASRQPWFKNTVFVLTADHTAQSEKSEYQSGMGMFALPIIFYDPQKNNGKIIPQTMQHIDILPSVLSYLGMEVEGNFFGKNVFDQEPLNDFPVVAYNFGTYFIEDQDCQMQYNGKMITGFSSKEVLEKVRQKVEKERLEKLLVSYIKIYEHVLKNNQIQEK